MSPKRALEAGDDLRRQRDLGHQHDRAAIARERGRRRAQVDLGLSRAGDAVQQQALGAAGRDRRLDRRERRRLRRRQRRGGGGRRRDRPPRAGGAAVARGARVPAARARPAAGRWRARRAAARGQRRLGGAQRLQRGPLARSQPHAAGERPRRPPPSARRPARCVRARAGPPPRPAPGGSTRPSARAGVEQYSSAIQWARRTSSAGTPCSSACSGAARRSGAIADSDAMPTTTPSTRAHGRRGRRAAPDLDAAEGGGSR